MIKENVRPEFVNAYRSSLEDSVSRLKRIVNRHELMISKIREIED